MEPIEIDLAAEFAVDHDPMSKLMTAMSQVEATHGWLPPARFYMNKRTMDKLAMARATMRQPEPGWDYRSATAFGIPILLEDLHDDMIVLITEPIDNPAMPLSATRQPAPEPPLPSTWQVLRRLAQRVWKRILRK